MNLLTTNLLPLGVICIGLLFAALILRQKGYDPRNVFLLSLVPGILLVVGIVATLNSTPGRIDVIDDDRDDDWLSMLIS